MSVSFRPSQVAVFYPESSFQKSEKESWAAVFRAYLASHGDNWDQEMDFQELFAWIEKQMNAAFPPQRVEVIPEEKLPEKVGFWVGVGNLIASWWQTPPVSEPAPQVSEPAPAQQPEAIPEVKLEVPGICLSIFRIFPDDMVHALISLTRDGFIARRDEGEGDAKKVFMKLKQPMLDFYANYVVPA